MRNAIINGGKLNSIKHIYNTRHRENLLFLSFSDKTKDYYTDAYPLSEILNDLLVDYLLNTEAKDSSYHKALCRIIEENEKQNPFDNLEDNQKYSFENIQEKLDSTYIKIIPDVEKIAVELNNKNLLVNKYLNKSDTSFAISIVALIITIFLSGYQIYQNYLTNKEIRHFTANLQKRSEEKNDSNKNSTNPPVE